MFRSIIHLIFLAVWISSCHAFSPQLENIFPRGAQRGTSIELHFHGDRLHDAKEILTYRPGISFAAISVHDRKHISAIATMSADCPLGEHQFRIRCESGISEMKILLIGQFPTVAEIEPNNTFDAPQTISLNSTVHGIVKNEDEDFFAVQLTKGQRLSAEVEAIRLGQEMFDAYVAILDPKRFELSARDDSPLLRTDAFAAIVAPEDGIYRVVVREAAYQGSDNCHYRLHISIAPRPSAVFPTGAKPGETVEFTFLADPSGPIKQTITLPESFSSPFAVFCQTDGLSAPSPNWIILHPLDYANEAEPNHTHQQATPLPPAPSAAQGIIQQDGDIDWFKFSAKKGQAFSIKAHALTLRSPLDTVLNLHDPTGKFLLNNDDQGSLDSAIIWDCPADGEYLLRTTDKLLKGAPDFVYRIEIKPRAPAISATLPVVERVLSQKWKMLPIPRGNRYATVVNFTRENIGCNLQLHALSLPAGVTMHAPPVPKGTTSFPVLFESTADAPIAGGLHTIQVKSGGDGAPADLIGSLSERIEHVDVNNQGSYHGTSVDRISMAVIQDVPLRIDLTTPAIPIVRNGTLPLIVKITRAPSYAEPFTLRFLWSPPGIGAPVTIDVPKDATEVIYPINANNEAALGTWPIVLLAEAKCPEGPFLVASNLANVTIAEPFLSASIDLCASEQGKPTPILVKLDVTTPFEGNATAELMGLPHGTKSPNITFASNAKELTFPLEITADATVGKHQSLFLKILIPQHGQQISHQLAHGSTLRIDTPRPVAPQAPAPDKSPSPAAKASTPPPHSPATKPLSRLEQLRQQKK